MTVGPRVTILVLVVVAAALGATAWQRHRQAMAPGPRQTPSDAAGTLSVASALHLCPRGGSSTVGKITVRGYLEAVQIAGEAGRLQGLFPTRKAGLSQSGRLAPVIPPSKNAVWLRGLRVPNGAWIIVTGTLDCVTQLPGVGDNGGTFAWLTPTA